MPITEGNRSFIDWWAEFEVSPADEAQIVDQVKNGVFRLAFQSIAEYLKKHG